MPKGKKNATVTSPVVVNRNTSVIEVGNDSYQIAPVSNGRGVDLRNSAGRIFIPMGETGQAIARELLNLTKVQVVAAKVKRTRRTKVQMDAIKAATATPAATPAVTPATDSNV